MLPVQLGLWYFGVAAWVFGLSERLSSSLVDGYPSASEIGLMAIAAFFFVAWLFLYPTAER